MRACFHGHTRIVQRLLDAGADMHLTSADGSSQLLVASSQGQLPVVKQLLNHSCGGRTIQTNGAGYGPRDANEWLALPGGTTQAREVMVQHYRERFEGGQGALVRAIMSRRSGQSALRRNLPSPHADQSIEVKSLLQLGSQLALAEAAKAASERGHWEVTQLLQKPEALDSYAQVTAATLVGYSSRQSTAVFWCYYGCA